MGVDAVRSVTADNDLAIRGQGHGVGFVPSSVEVVVDDASVAEGRVQHPVGKKLEHDHYVFWADGVVPGLSTGNDLAVGTESGAANVVVAVVGTGIEQEFPAAGKVGVERSVGIETRHGESRAVKAARGIS